MKCSEKWSKCFREFFYCFLDEEKLGPVAVKKKERKKGVNDGNLLVVFTSAVFHENINLWEDRF